MTALRFLVIALIGACTSASADRDDPKPEPPARQVDGPMVALHMRARFDDLRAVERMLVHGRLADARERARALAEAPQVFLGGPWTTKAQRVRILAQELSQAQSVDSGLRLATRVSAACVECHVAAGMLPRFAHEIAPADTGAIRARMARHAWAADRMWEGMIGAADEPWSEGLHVLAATPLPFSAADGDRLALSHQLQRFATTALATRTTDTLDDRVRTYGELLVTCAACHDQPQRSP